MKQKNLRKVVNKKVAVAISGGVDSAVAASLLRKANFQVIGIFMQFWNPPEDAAAMEMARRVANFLQIPLYVFDLRQEFRRYIVDYYLTEYQKGRTPNPCVRCNKIMKFGILWEKCVKLNVDYLATGHYVRLAPDILQEEKYEYLPALYEAKDKKKDQSYFLWDIPYSLLPNLIFPIGSYFKSEIREMAEKLGLPSAKSEESQGFCFLRQEKASEFIRKNIKSNPGPIKDLEGNTVGTHPGLAYFTIGQREGLSNLEIKKMRVKDRHKIPPFYVVDFDFKNNVLIVGENKFLYKKSMLVDEVNWLDSEIERIIKLQKKSIKASAKVRYGHPKTDCFIYATDKQTEVKVVFAQPVRAITPGQSVAFYCEEQLLGGGIIKRAINE